MKISTFPWKNEEKKTLSMSNIKNVRSIIVFLLHRKLCRMLLSMVGRKECRAKEACKKYVDNAYLMNAFT